MYLSSPFHPAQRKGGVKNSSGPVDRTWIPLLICCPGASDSSSPPLGMLAAYLLLLPLLSIDAFSAESTTLFAELIFDVATFLLFHFQPQEACNIVLPMMCRGQLIYCVIGSMPVLFWNLLSRGERGRRRKDKIPKQSTQNHWPQKYLEPCIVRRYSSLSHHDLTIIVQRDC